MEEQATPPRGRTRRQQKDHERYMRERDVRLARQREYYATHREQCLKSVKESVRRRSMREYMNRLAKSQPRDPTDYE